MVIAVAGGWLTEDLSLQVGRVAPQTSWVDCSHPESVLCPGPGNELLTQPQELNFPLRIVVGHTRSVIRPSRTLKGIEAMHTLRKGQARIFAYGHSNPDVVIVEKAFAHA